MSAPNIFLLMDRSGMEPLVRLLYEIFESRQITCRADDYFISDKYRDSTYFNVLRFDIEDYLLFSLDQKKWIDVANTMARFRSPHVCRIVTRDLSQINKLAVALFREIDFVMDNDHGLLIHKDAFLRFAANGIDWLRLAPG